MTMTKSNKARRVFDRMKRLVRLVPPKRKTRSEIIEEIKFQESEYRKRQKQLDTCDLSDEKKLMVKEVMGRYAARRIALRWAIGLE